MAGTESDNTRSPFHRGEREIQARLGVRDKLESLGRRVIRDHMPDQHRSFYEQLPLLVVGAVDEADRPWASILAGPPGFITSPDARTLRVAAQPLAGDPLGPALTPGRDVGLLGLEFHTRRRNRMNGRISQRSGEGFEIAVEHAYGNCPQYIQKRAFRLLPEHDRPAGATEIRRSDTLRDVDRALVSAADTFFIATRYLEDESDASHGADVSHRGGKPGFVRIDDDRNLTWPDFAGNSHFNTLGNLLLHPRAGLLFVDFDTGDLLALTGRAEIIWDGPEVEAFDGALRLVRFTLDELVRLTDSLPIRWEFGGYSPVLEKTGSWGGA